MYHILCSLFTCQYGVWCIIVQLVRQSMCACDRIKQYTCNEFVDHFVSAQNMVKLYYLSMHALLMQGLLLICRCD